MTALDTAFAVGALDESLRRAESPVTEATPVGGATKRLFDVVLGSAVSLVSLPVIALLAVGVCLSVRTWRPFFVQDRIGLGGRRIRIPKLRTLPLDCPPYALKATLGHLRLGRFAAFLRRSHLDELPQLLVVPLGRLSLVGPRPKMPDEFEPVDPAYAAMRSQVPPGCTGLWQIGPHSYAQPDAHPHYDAFYVARRGLRLDGWILWRTLLLMARLGGPVGLDAVPDWAVGRRRHRRAGAVLLVAAVTLGATVAVSGPAQAAPPSVTALAPGWSHTCALLSTGKVQCWGANHVGQLGDGTSTTRTRPVDVVGLDSTVMAIAAGGNHTCAIVSGGAVKCWGGNGFGGIGDGTFTDRWTPTSVAGIGSGASAIALGAFFSCAVTTSAVKCWGENDFGQLGNGTTIDSPTPVDVLGLTPGSISAITAGGKHTCAVTSSGGLKCWGHNGYGQLGDGTGLDSGVPVDVSGVTSGASAVAAGGRHTCGRLSGGGVKCWGNNVSGQVGDGSTINRSIPVNVSGLTSGTAALTTGRWRSCSVVSGALKCWGSLQGANANPKSLVPTDITGLGAGVVSAMAGEGHTCAAMTNGGAKCFGDNSLGQLGDGTTTASMTAVTVQFAGMGGAAVADFAGDASSDVSVFRPSTGAWYIDGGASSFWGTSGDVPVPADYDGDGDADLAVFRPSSGAWFVLGGSTSYWGTSGDVPVPGDYDGDGDTDFAVFRPSSGAWFVLGGATTYWGTDGDVPVSGDYDGDGDTDLAVFRPSTGAWFVKGGASTYWGTTNDVPVPGDYDADGDTDLSVFRPSSGAWFVLGGATTYWGATGDVPVPGDYDGDGDADLAVFRPSSGAWFVQGGPTKYWGGAGDRPLPLPPAIYAAMSPA